MLDVDPKSWIYFFAGHPVDRVPLNTVKSKKKKNQHQGYDSVCYSQFY